MASHVVRVLALIVLGLLTAGHAQAEIICGDADDSGSITVTDGVQTLRAAADLSSECSSARCDIDGNGDITVTDGVNVLRKVANLVVTDACPAATVTEQTQDVFGDLKKTLPLFGTLTKFAPAQAATTFACDNEDGFIEFDDQTGAVEFFNCQLDVFVFDGSLAFVDTGSVESFGLSFDLSFVDVTTDETSELVGDLSLRTIDDGGSVIAGNLALDFEELGSVDVVFEDVITDIDGVFVGGSLLFDATDTGIDGAVGIRVGFVPDTVLPVTVIFDDASTLEFDFDLFSGELTPVAN